MQAQTRKNSSARKTPARPKFTETLWMARAEKRRAAREELARAEAKLRELEGEGFWGFVRRMFR